MRPSRAKSHCGFVGFARLCSPGAAKYMARFGRALNLHGNFMNEAPMYLACAA